MMKKVFFFKALRRIAGLPGINRTLIKKQGSLGRGRILEQDAVVPGLDLTVTINHKHCVMLEECKNSVFSDTAGNNVTSVNNLTFQLIAHLNNCIIFFHYLMLAQKNLQVPFLLWAFSRAWARMWKMYLICKHILQKKKIDQVYLVLEFNQVRLK